MKSRDRRELLAFEATVETLAPGGDGVAKVEIAGERRAVFVRGGAPGDRLKVEVDASHRPARGRILEIVSAGPGRVEPACAWVERCGGCDWMHVDAATQSRAHVDQLRAALPAAWREIEITTHAAPSPFAYRTRARVHVRATGGRAIVGMNEAASNDPVEVDRCAVLTPDLERARARLSALLEGAHGRGEAQIALGAYREPRPGVLELRWSGNLAAACFGRIERAITDGHFSGARVWQGEANKPATIGDPTPWMRAADGEPLRLAPGGFGQASDEGNALLARRVADLAKIALGAREDPRVLELYAGAGNLTVLLARLAKTLVAVESSRESCDAARLNLSARALQGSRLVESDAGTFAIPAQTHLIVLDPPRSGARDACTRIAASTTRHVLYVSCDAQTLGRDLAILEAARFAPLAVDAFDLFPQTSHVESAVLLERKRG